MERPETGTHRTCVDPALGILEHLVPEELYFLGDPRIRTTVLDFRFLKMLFWGLDHWQVSEKFDWHLRSVTSTVGDELRETIEEFQAHIECVVRRGESTSWKALLLDQLEKRIEPLKPQAQEICILALGGEIGCKPCQQDQELFLEYGRETASFIEFVVDNLQTLNFEYDLIDLAKQQIDFIIEKLQVFRKFANLVSPSINRVKNLGELMSQTRFWANQLSCLACLYWIDHGMDETLASSMGTMLSNLMQKTMPYTPGIITSYFEATLMQQLLARYFDFLLRELVTPPMKDDIETLVEGLILLLSFMTDPPEEDSEDKELILGQIYSIINELPSLICSIHSNEMKDMISETKLSDLLKKIAGVEAEIRKIYAVTPRSSQFNSPRTNPMGFLDSLLQKLKEWLEREVNFVTRVKLGIGTVREELASLRPFMQHLIDLQNEQEELKDLWNRIVDVVYYAAYVTNLCAAKSFSIWFGIICLPSVIEEIKLIKNEVREIKNPLMYANKMLSVETESRDALLPRATTSKVEGAFIGFREDTRLIIDHLIGGRKDLTIISISGMPGQGKTTLAKRIYNDPRIQYHFHKIAWCYVSKECKIRDLMIDIVLDVCKTDVEYISKLETEDIADILRKSLKGNKYLIVMDDIWDDGVWCQVQSSLPDDGLGSRILFTSRNRNLKPQNELNLISYPLRSFSQEESWDLMKEKLHGLGPEFVEIGKQIAESCKGLPLAVALVASLLGKMEQKLELWNQISENIKSHLASEGCTHIIELSYKYLPEHLKSCFLYFGAFPRGKNIHAERLKLLWIAEGFIKGNKTQYSEKLAEECLDYLVSQSLVVVAQRSSKGGIKACNIHDLIYDLCLKEIEEENFLHLVNRNTILDESGFSPGKYGHHRLCIGRSDPFIKARPSSRRMELPTSPVQSLVWLERFSGNEFFASVMFYFLKSFRLISVLDLEEVEMPGDVFPEVILCNIHLKYLVLRERITHIPPRIAELLNLETLIMRGGPYGLVRRIPDSIWRMKKLRHVRIDRGCLTLEDFEGNECYMAAQDSIETLGGMVLGDDPRTVEFLRRMKRLRKLKCRGAAKDLHPAWFSIFGTSEKLEELKIQLYCYRTRVDLGTCSSFPHHKNLSKLTLEELKLSWSAMSTIGKHLPNLEVLILLYNACVGRRWDLEDDEFLKLRYLKLRNLHDLEEINVWDCDSPFPCLEVFIVEDCPKLEEIPCSFGDICSLNTIKMRWCHSKASKSVMQILEQQRDLGNESLQIFVKDTLRDSEEETEGKAEATEKEEEEESN